MNNRFFTLVKQAIGAPLLWIALSSSAQAGPIVSVSPPQSSVSIGDTVTVAIDINAATELYAYQFDILFDPVVLEAIAVEDGEFLTSAGSTIFFPGIIDNFSGAITFNLASLVGASTGQSGNGVLAWIRFDAKSGGTSAINIDSLVLLDNSLAEIPASTLGGRIEVEVATVPEPSTLGLLMLGFFALSPWRSSHRRAYLVRPGWSK